MPTWRVLLRLHWLKQGAHRCIDQKTLIRTILLCKMYVLLLFNSNGFLNGSGALVGDVESYELNARNIAHLDDGWLKMNRNRPFCFLLRCDTLLLLTV